MPTSSQQKASRLVAALKTLGFSKSIAPHTFSWVFDDPSLSPEFDDLLALLESPSASSEYAILPLNHILSYEKLKKDNKIKSGSDLDSSWKDFQQIQSLSSSSHSPTDKSSIDHLRQQIASLSSFLSSIPPTSTSHSTSLPSLAFDPSNLSIFDSLQSDLMILADEFYSSVTSSELQDRVELLLSRNSEITSAIKNFIKKYFYPELEDIQSPVKMIATPEDLDQNDDVSTVQKAINLKRIQFLGRSALHSKIESEISLFLTQTFVDRVVKSNQCFISDFGVGSDINQVQSLLESCLFDSTGELFSLCDDVADLRCQPFLIGDYQSKMNRQQIKIKLYEQVISFLTTQQNILNSGLELIKKMLPSWKKLFQIFQNLCQFLIQPGIYCLN
ncbi:hypothetical protein GEMRC1_013879 [Eukaryota sp. GEM-RC1]